MYIHSIARYDGSCKTESAANGHSCNGYRLFYYIAFIEAMETIIAWSQNAGSAGQNTVCVALKMPEHALAAFPLDYTIPPEDRIANPDPEISAAPNYPNRVSV